MATVVLLYKAQDVKDSGWVDENVDEKIIRACIEVAQDVYTRDIIGTGLFDELKSQKQAGTLTTLNTTLLTYVAKSLLFWTLWEGMDSPGFNMKIRNKAVMTSSSDNSQPSQLNELAKMASYFKDKAQYYDERLIRYLIQNQSSFPLYYNPGNGVDTIHPRGSSYNTGWAMGSGSDCTTYRGPDSTIDL